MAATETAANVAANQGAEGPSPEASATLTDEQIIGLGPGAEAEAAEPEVQPEGEATLGEQPPAAEEPPTEAQPPEEIPQDGRTIPAELREIFKANPKLRDSYFSERAYREVFPTVREARELKEIFPGGIEDAKLYRDGAETLQHFDGLLVANTPESRAQFFEEISQVAPEAAKELAWDSVSRLPQIDPEGYKAAMEGAFAERLPEWAAREGLPEHSQLLLQALERGETDQATQLARRLVEWTRGIGQAQKAEPAKGADPEVERLKAELAARDQRERQQAEESLRSDLTGRYAAEIKQFLEKAVPSASERARHRMADEIVKAVNGQLAQSPHFMSQFNTLRASGQMREAADLAMGRAKQLLPQVGRRILNEWTSEILAANKTAVAKKTAAAQSRDVGSGGAPAGTSGGKPGKIDYSKMSDTDILGS